MNKKSLSKKNHSLKSVRQINLLQLYPDDMNIYGDFGNSEIVSKRLSLYGYKVNLLKYNSFKDRANLLKADIILGGGGQDSGQKIILDDLQLIKDDIIKLAKKKVPMLMICGLYQLFGKEFILSDGSSLAGVGLFDLVTKAGSKRLIGNAICDTEWGQLIGYENHSGLTSLNEGQSALGYVIKGYGNNGKDRSEGAVKCNVFGSYLHGPILAKNTAFADHLILKAINLKFNEKKLQAKDKESAAILDTIDRISKEARLVAASRPQ